MTVDDITGAILDASVKIHRELGPGLIESVYEALLARLLEARGFTVRRQHPVRFEFDGITIDHAFRADLLVENTVIVELKAAARLEPIFARQLLTYLRLARCPVGLVINFGGQTLHEGVKRVVNNYQSMGLDRLLISSKRRERNTHL